MRPIKHPYMRINVLRNVNVPRTASGGENNIETAASSDDSVRNEGNTRYYNKKLQFICAFLLFASGAYIFLMVSNGTWKEMNFPLITTTPSAVIPGKAGSRSIPNGAPSTTFRDMTLFSEISDTGVSVPVGYSIAAFCLLSGIAEFAALAAMLVYSTFPSEIIYTMRFLEYSVTASIMQVVICVQLGIWDWRALVGIVGLTVTCMWCGIIGERNVKNDPTTAWLAFITGCVAFCFTWMQVFANFHATWLKNADAPDFIWAIVVTEFFLFALFGAVQFVQLLSKEEDNGKVTSRYIVLSIFSKMVLAWVVVWQVLANKD